MCMEADEAIERGGCGYVERKAREGTAEIQHRQREGGGTDTHARRRSRSEIQIHTPHGSIKMQRMTQMQMKQVYTRVC